MKLNDVMKDSKIKIHANINGHGILLITKAVVGVRDGLLVESLTYFDEDMEFREPSKVVAVNKRDGRTYEFEADSIGPVTTKYGHYHLIRCTKDSSAINRRKSERFDIDRLGVIRIGEDGDIRNALVYDISMRGIAFILDSEAKCKLGDKIIASFRYDPNYFHFYACKATVVRAFTIDNQVAIGCTIDSMGADLITLISNKKHEKSGVDVEEMLPVSKSTDEAIAQGTKIPVNYSPPLPDSQLISLDDAADLIPERKEEEIIAARAKRVADLEELATIEDRTPIAPVSRTRDLAHDNLGLDDFDGYFNQHGRAVDEELFTARKDDGFLTPEQIADIIELEHIHNN